MTTSRREEVQFSVGSEYCSSWLYTPDDTAGPVPVVVMAHGFGAVKGLRLDAYAERFCDAGYACLVFDYRYFGDSGGKPGELVDIDSQLEDWRAAVAHARSLPEIDGDRLILWGTSFSGGHVMVTAANDSRVAAIIAQCPFTDGDASSSKLGLTTAAKLTVRGLRDLVAKWRGNPPVRVPTTAAPGELGLMTAPDAIPGEQALIEASDIDELPNRVPARIALYLPRYTPGESAKDVNCPFLVAVCENDSVAPPELTVEYAQQAPKSEIKRYDVGHFDIYLGDAFEKAVQDQIEFLKRHVPPQ